jgi:hypothetical protein
VGILYTSVTEFKLQPESKIFRLPRVVVDTAATYPFFTSYNSLLFEQSFSAAILCYCTWYTLELSYTTTEVKIFLFTPTVNPVTLKLIIFNLILPKLSYIQKLLNALPTKINVKLI